MRKTIVTSMTAIGLFFSIAVHGVASGSVVVDRVVAVVNDEIITLSDLQREESQKKVDSKIDERLLL